MDGRIEFPDVATGEEIAAAAGLPKVGGLSSRRQGELVECRPVSHRRSNNGARFVDAPPRVKGFRV